MSAFLSDELISTEGIAIYFEKNKRNFHHGGESDFICRLKRVINCTYNVLFKGAMALLRPLLLDVVPSIQQTAALALGRLANYNEDLAEAVVKGDILPQLVYSLAEQNVMFL